MKCNWQRKFSILCKSAYYHPQQHECGNTLSLSLPLVDLTKLKVKHTVGLVTHLASPVLSRTGFVRATPACWRNRDIFRGGWGHWSEGYHITSYCDCWARNGQTGLARRNLVWAPCGLAIWVPPTAEPFDVCQIVTKFSTWIALNDIFTPG